MRRLLVGLVGIAVVAGALAWFSEPFQEPTEAAQEATLTAKHVEIALPPELALGDVQPLAAIPYTDDFEGPWPGPWQLINPGWGRVDCNSHSPTHSASASGDPACTTYYNNQYSWLVYGPFDLSGAPAAGADYWFDLDIENGYDFLLVMASADGNSFCGWQFSGNSGGWTNAYPLDFADPGCPNLLGDPDVWFAFIFLSDDIIPYPGAWVDDVCIWRDDPSACLNGGGPPPNDDFDDAIVAEPQPFSHSEDTSSATVAGDDPAISCALDYEHTVWFDKTPPAGACIAVETFGSNYDTVLSVYTGPRGSLTEETCDDDTGSLQSRVVFEAAGGTTYHIMVASYGGGPGGNLEFYAYETDPSECVPGCWDGLPPLAAGADLAPPSPAETGEDIGVREGTPPSAAGEEAIPGELIVKFNPSVSQSEGEAAVKLEGSILLRPLLVPGYALVSVPKGEEEQFIARLEANPKVELAEPNIIRRAIMVPNDPLYPYQWHLPQIQMEQAWDVANGSGVVVAVIDTGVAYENYDGYVQAPDLAGTSFTPGCDFENNDYHANDDEGHGTHVTGTVAQTTNNSLGTAGVAYGATIMPVKVLDEYGSGSVANIADGIKWAADYGADVINLSLGGGYASVEEDAINYALANGVVVVAATGNGNASSLSCPACYPGVIAVGATDYNMNRAPYSNYGCDPGGSGHCLDVVAPGGDTSADENSDTYPDGVLQQTLLDACPEPLQVDVDPPFAYCLYQGTSMASPHVAGAAALLLDANPSLTVQQVGDCLRDTALDLGAADYDAEYGHGLIQVRDALDSCSGGPPPVDCDVMPGPVVAFEVSKGQETDDAPEFIADLISQGYSVGTVDISAGPIPWCVDALVVMGLKGNTHLVSAYSAAEGSALQSWVAGGGGLMLLGEWGGFKDATQALTQALGYTQTGTNWVTDPTDYDTYPYWPIYQTDNFTPHPILSGVNEMVLLASSWLEPSDAAIITTDADASPPQEAVAAATQPGSGCAAIYSDTNWVQTFSSGYDRFDNAQVALQTIQWLVECPGAGEPAIVRIGSGRAPTCTEGSVSLEILGPPRPVGAVTVDIVYNPAVADPTGPIDPVPGTAYDTVLCSLDYTPNTVRCTGISATGVPGDSLLADITFHCIGETGECSPLEVQIVTFADPDGIPILPVTAEDGEFCCGGCGDVDCNGNVDAVDALFALQYVVNMRGASDQCPPPPGALYLPAANVNCDDIVDAVDALFILQHVVGLRPDLCVCTEP